jgi:hypothetical protein
MFRVSADIEYMQGNLSGIEIPAGYTVTVPNMRRALSVARWLGTVKRQGDFIRAAVTGNKYRVCGRIAIDQLGGQS